MQKFSPIKKRILQFAETLRVSKRDFYKKTGISRGTLENNTGITEDILVKFIATFPEISIEWLITGRGEMLRAVGAVRGQESPPEPPQAAALPDQSALVAALQQTIATQAELIAELKRRCAGLEGKPPNGATEHQQTE